MSKLKNENNYQFRACVDEKVVGYFPSMSAAMRFLTAKRIKEVGGPFGQGYVDCCSPEWLYKKGEEEWSCMRHRMLASMGTPGWYWND